MIPVAKRLARIDRKAVAVYRLLNSARGWDTQHTPVQDVAWALGEIGERLGGARPTALVGHSLGGRAAILSAARPEVRTVAALAAWVYPDDVPAGLDGERILLVHGTADRIASPARAQALAGRLAARADAEFVPVEGGKHAMLRHRRAFLAPALEAIEATLERSARQRA